MLTRKLHKDKVNIITLGCSKNLVDSEELSGQLSANGVQVGHEREDDDHNVVIVNTCGFIDKAKEESVQTILEQAMRKSAGDIEKLYVTGCLSQRYREDLAKEIPEVDRWFGTMELPQILKQFEADYREELVGERMLSTPSHYAYMKISEGCNRTCAFCAIPLMRGGHRSKPMEEIVAEARRLVSMGVKEIMLIAQELTYYGLDLYKKRALADLLRKLSDVEGLVWIRLHYAYPTQFPLDVLDVIAERPNICRYVDMPLQHISDRILHAMRRQQKAEDIYRLIHTIRDRIPEICIRSTFIAGFPTETRHDVEMLQRFLEEVRLDRVGIFTYSHEENTRAYDLEDTVPADEKEARAREIMEVQQEISYEKNLEKVGKQMQVMIDRKESGRWLGRTEFDSVEVDNEVILPGHTDLQPGQMVQARITKAYDYDLEAELIDLR